MGFGRGSGFWEGVEDFGEAADAGAEAAIKQIE
jgi:hypothetical protein